MKVLVTLNVWTDADLANRTWGEIVDIILHLEEQLVDHEQRIVKLRQLLSYILVKLLTPLPELLSNVVPIQPVKKTFSYTPKGSTTSVSVIRCQWLLVTGTYTFTDYRSQGQTIKNVTVNITPPPSGGELDTSNLYVALSGSSGRDTICILHIFEWSCFKKNRTSGF